MVRLLTDDFGDRSHNAAARDHEVRPQRTLVSKLVSRAAHVKVLELPRVAGRLRNLTNSPGIPTVDYGLEGVVIVAQAGSQCYLVPGQVVVRRGLDIAEDANRRPMQHAGIGEPGEPKGERRVRQVGVVNDQRVLSFK